jgi:hypothetical protein
MQRSTTSTSTLILLLLLPVSFSVLVLSPLPPAGFNTFDTYGYSWLNASGVEDLLRLFAASPLLQQGNYNMITGGFSGWSQTPLSNGSVVTHLDEWGRPTPAPERFPPGSMAEAAAIAKSLGIKFGLWIIRGVHISAVARRLPVKGAAGYTIDMIVDQANTGGGANGSCLWDSEWLGVNASHPAAQAWYNSQVENLVDLGVEVVEADCMMCEPCYWGEMDLMTAAVRARPEPLTLYYSPGGGNSPTDSQIVANKQMATFYRTLTDFHGGWYDWGGLQQAIIIAGNFTAARLHGANETWPDLDMIPLGQKWWNKTIEQDDRGQTIATLWMIGRYPLFAAGSLPLDTLTLSYLMNPDALALNRRVEIPTALTHITYEGNCTCTGPITSCTIPHGPDNHPIPCVTKWVATVVSQSVPVVTWTALAIINLGEDTTSTMTTGFDVLHLPTKPTDFYYVQDIWTGKEVGCFTGNSNIQTQLRPHASILFRVTVAASC